MTTQNQNEAVTSLNLTAEHYQEYFRRYPDREVYLKNIVLEDYLKTQKADIERLKVLVPDSTPPEK